jgi:acetyltransferase-like isoleucine patch superfamily enzyme
MKLLKDIVIPHESVNDENVVIVMLYFNDWDWVNKGDTVIEIETSKAIFTLDAPSDGYILYNCKKGDQVLIGAVVAGIFDEKEQPGGSKAPTDNKTENKSIVSNIKTIFSAKATRLIEEYKISESEFEGQDFVSHNDVLLFLNKNKKSSSEVRKFTLNDTSSLLKPDTRSEIKNKVSSVGAVEIKKERIVVICPSIIGVEVIEDIIEGQENKEIIGFVADDNYKADIDLPFLDCNVFDFPQKIDKLTYDTVIIAMGGSLKSMQFRKKVFDHYMNEGVRFTNLVSRQANIGKNFRIGVGNIIGSGVFIGTGSRIGDNNFISYMTTIGHHNIIGNNNLFAPGVMMSGLVEVGDDCILTTGVNFIDKVKIGNRVILPLGYNVVSNIADDTVIKMRS